MLTPTITTTEYLESNESALVRTSGWEAAVSFTELSAFHKFAMHGRIGYDELEESDYYKDLSKRHEESMMSFASLLSTDGFRVGYHPGSGARREVFVATPTGEFIEDLFDGTIQHGRYAGQVDFEPIVLNAVTVAKRAWLGGPDTYQAAQDAYCAELNTRLKRLEHIHDLAISVAGDRARAYTSWPDLVTELSQGGNSVLLSLSGSDRAVRLQVKSALAELLALNSPARVTVELDAAVGHPAAPRPQNGPTVLLETINHGEYHNKRYSYLPALTEATLQAFQLGSPYNAHASGALRAQMLQDLLATGRCQMGMGWYETTEATIFDNAGFNRYGLDEQGLDADGNTPFGFDPNRTHRVAGTKFDCDGLDAFAYPLTR
jgi:hypothetical protein